MGSSVAALFCMSRNSVFRRLSNLLRYRSVTRHAILLLTNSRLREGALRDESKNRYEGEYSLTARVSYTSKLQDNGALQEKRTP